MADKVLVFKRKLTDNPTEVMSYYLNKPTISIIIPVYGVEKYIVKCIESIKKQTFTHFEAILINDGTKDDSVALAEKAIAGDERFIILHKENGGQGSARNPERDLTLFIF